MCDIGGRALINKVASDPLIRDDMNLKSHISDKFDLDMAVDDDWDDQIMSSPTSSVDKNDKVPLRRAFSDSEVTANTSNVPRPAAAWGQGK
jgi:hypothetical protein